MHFKLLNPSKYIDESDFVEQRERMFTVASVVIDELEGQKGQKERKGIIGFKETPKMLVINVTNANSMKSMFGVETNAWIGKRVVFHREEWWDPFQNKQSSATRIKGSPDITAPISVVTKLRGKKTDTRTMQVIGKAPQVAPLAGDDLAKEIASIEGLITDCTGDFDATWTKNGFGKRIPALPKADGDRLTALFRERKRAAKTEPQAEEAAPPA